METLVNGNILLVGEGDFSFTVSLVKKVAGGRCTGIIATSIETEESIEKHRLAATNITWLQEHGITVLLEIDATRLHLHPSMIGNKFSSVIFNFPHTGGKSNHKRNRKLLKDFFASAVQVLEDTGQILMTLCKGQGGTAADRPMREWHDSWQVVSMAANSSLILVMVVPFKADDYSVYSSTGFRSLDKGFNTDNALTHVFEITEPIQVPALEEQIKVKVDDTVFLCPSYICRKLIQIRVVNANRCHPVHRVYDCITRRIQDSASTVHQTGSHPLNSASTVHQAGSHPLDSASTIHQTGSHPLNSASTVHQAGSHPLESASTVHQTGSHPLDSASTVHQTGSHPLNSASTVHQTGSHSLDSASTVHQTGSHPLDSASTIHQSGLHPLVSRQITEHLCQFRLTNTEGSADDELVDISDLVQRNHNTELAQQNLYIVNDPVNFIPIQMYDKIQVTYGPVYKPCVISKIQSATSYHMTIVWPITVDQTWVQEGHGGSLIESDMLNKVVNDITSLFPQILNTVICQREVSFELLSYPAKQRTYSSMDLSAGIHMADIIVHWSKVGTANLEAFQLNVEDEIEVVGRVDSKLAGDSSALSHLLVYVTVDLSILACLRYCIHDERLLWSTHSAVLDQFHQLDDHFPTGVRNVEISGQTALNSSVTVLKDSVGLDTHTPNPTVTVLKDSIAEDTCTLITSATLLKQSALAGTLTPNPSTTLLSTSVVADTRTLNPSTALLKESTSCGIKSPSLYPMRFIHDMSFWENKDIPFSELEYSNIIRNVADDNVIMLELIDTYIDEASGSCSRCYRLTFQSLDGALSYNTSWKLQSLIRLQVERQMNIKLR